MSKEIQIVNEIKQCEMCESCPLRVEAEDRIRKLLLSSQKVLQGEKVHMVKCEHSPNLTLKGLLKGEAVRFFGYVASDAKIKLANANGGYFRAPMVTVGNNGACPQVVSDTVDKWFIKIGLG